MSKDFWSRIAVGEPDACWPWQDYIHADYGYGYINGGLGSSPLRAHRVAYEKAHGPIPEGQYVLHRCDNRACCNPAHLFLGTHQDNMDDMVAKGRQIKGEAQHMAHLTEDDVLRIRQDTTRSLQSWADELGVTPTSIHNVRMGKTWKHVGGARLTTDGRQGSHHHLSTLSESDVHFIRNDPRMSRDLAALFRVSEGTISRIRTGKTWKHVL